MAVAGLGLLAYAAYRYHRMDTDYLSKPLSEQTPEDHAEWREYLRNTHYIAATGHILGWTGIAILAGPAMGGIGGGFAYFGLAGELIFTGISGMGLAYGIKSGIVEGRSIYRDWDRLEGYEVYERIGLLVVPTLAGIASGGLYGPRAYRGVYKDTGRWVGRWNDWRAGGAAQTAPVPTGQIHHPISTRVGRALDSHPTLRGQFQPRDPRFTTRAIDEAAHRGYQQWHRDLDAEVVRWINDPANARATPQQFLDWLRQRYNQPDLRARFPNGF